MKRYVTLLSAETWMELDDIMLIEVGQKEKDKNE